MDYVVYGTGYGATLMLLGYALRTWGPKLRFAEHDEGAYDRQEFRSARAAWTRFTSGLGAVIVTCGAVLALFTFLIMAINPGNSVGVIVALIVSAASLIAVAAWSWLYFSRYGVWGVLKTPEALSSYQPMQYDPRAQAVNVATASAPGDQVVDDAVDEEEPALGHDEVLDESDEEFEARYSKYQSHHPDGEITVGVVPEEKASPEPETVDEAEPTTEAPDDAAQTDDDGTDEDVTPESEADEALAEDITGDADAQTEPPEDDVQTESAGEVEVTTPVEAENTIETLEVLPEAHEPRETDAEQSPEASETDDSAGNVSGGREDALRRLRERRAQRQAAKSDDA